MYMYTRVHIHIHTHIYIYMYIYLAVSHWYDREEVSNGELPRFFAECCIRGPGGAHKGLAHKGPGPTRAPWGGPQGSGA